MPPVFCIGAQLPDRSGKVFEAAGRQSKLGMLENAISDFYFFFLCVFGTVDEGERFVLRFCVQ